MVITNADVDPYSPTENYYECRDCDTRLTGSSVTACEDCGSDAVFNIAVPRE